MTADLLGRAAVAGHHVAGTPTEWRHGWEPISLGAAKSHYHNRVPPYWQPRGLAGKDVTSGRMKHGDWHRGHQAVAPAPLGVLGNEPIREMDVPGHGRQLVHGSYSDPWWMTNGRGGWAVSRRFRNKAQTGYGEWKPGGGEVESFPIPANDQRVLTRVDASGNPLPGEHGLAGTANREFPTQDLAVAHAEARAKLTSEGSHVYLKSQTSTAGGTHWVVSTNRPAGYGGDYYAVDKAGQWTRYGGGHRRYGTWVPDVTKVARPGAARFDPSEPRGRGGKWVHVGPSSFTYEGPPGGDGHARAVMAVADSIARQPGMADAATDVRNSAKAMVARDMAAAHRHLDGAAYLDSINAAGMNRDDIEAIRKSYAKVPRGAVTEPREPEVPPYMSQQLAPGLKGRPVTPGVVGSYAGARRAAWDPEAERAYNPAELRVHGGGHAGEWTASLREMSPAEKKAYIKTGQLPDRLKASAPAAAPVKPEPRAAKPKPEPAAKPGPEPAGLAEQRRLTAMWTRAFRFSNRTQGTLRDAQFTNELHRLLTASGRSGKPTPGATDAHDFLALADRQATRQPALYRGLSLSDEAVARLFPPGGTVDLPLGSWGKREETAHAFAGEHGVIVSMPPGAKGLDLAPIERGGGPELDYRAQLQEVVTGGRFTVSSVTRRGGVTYVTLGAQGEFHAH